MNRHNIVGAVALAGIATTVLTPIVPARAQLAVVDVRSIAQMLKQVEQATQQVAQLKAQLSAQQNMLAKLGSNISPELAGIVGDATSIMRSATGIGYNAKSLTSQLDTIYPKDLMGQSWEQVLSRQADWETRSRDTRREALEAQNAIVDSQGRTQGAVNRAVDASQSAAGQTGAIQATNQLLAALSTQLTGLQTLLITQMRAAQTAEAQNAGIRAAANATMTNGTAVSTRKNQVGRQW